MLIYIKPVFFLYLHKLQLADSLYQILVAKFITQKRHFAPHMPWKIFHTCTPVWYTYIVDQLNCTKTFLLTDWQNTTATITSHIHHTTIHCTFLILQDFPHLHKATNLSLIDSHKLYSIDYSIHMSHLYWHRTKIVCACICGDPTLHCKNHALHKKLKV